MKTHEEKLRQEVQNTLLLQILMLARITYPQAVFHEDIHGEQFGLFSISFLRRFFTRRKQLVLGVVWFEYGTDLVGEMPLLRLHFVIDDPKLSKSGLAEQVKYLFEQGPEDQHGSLPYSVEVCIRDHCIGERAEPKAA